MLKTHLHLRRNCEFYESLGFDYGISLDHMIFEFDPEYDDGTSLLTKSPTEEMERRFHLSIDNAKAMRRICEEKQYRFHLMGGVQGWSPQSYHRAVKELIEDGFDYIALGGRLAPMTINCVRSWMRFVRRWCRPTPNYTFWESPASVLEDYARTNVASCDSASTILQAFKSNKDSYHTREKNYTAVRSHPHQEIFLQGSQTSQERGGETARPRRKLRKRLIELEQQALKDPEPTMPRKCPSNRPWNR